MKIAMLLRSGPATEKAARALQTAEDMLSQGHAVSLFCCRMRCISASRAWRVPQESGSAR
jgi:hypothetical protein